MQIRKMRILRMKYDISCVELGRACGLSAQRISELELGDGSVETATKEKIQLAFLNVLTQRTETLCRLTQDYVRWQDDLMDMVEETAYEL